MKHGLRATTELANASSVLLFASLAHSFETVKIALTKYYKVISIDLQQKGIKLTSIIVNQKCWAL